MPAHSANNFKQARERKKPQGSYSIAQIVFHWLANMKPFVMDFRFPKRMECLNE
jgi:hypothetical protein